MTEKTRREVVVAAVEEALEPVDELLGHLHNLPNLIPKRTPVMRRTVTVSQARRAITKMKGDMQLPKLPPGEDPDVLAQELEEEFDYLQVANEVVYALQTQLREVSDVLSKALTQATEKSLSLLDVAEKLLEKADTKERTHAVHRAMRGRRGAGSRKPS